jgi:hypothetical protein
VIEFPDVFKINLVMLLTMLVAMMADQSHADEHCRQQIEYVRLDGAKEYFEQVQTRRYQHR